MMKATADLHEELGLRQNEVLHFPLHGLLSTGHTLAMHVALGSVSQIVLMGDEPKLVEQQIFAPGEICLLKPLLEAYPDYCPTEVLLANLAGGNVTERAIERCRQHLHRALDEGTWSRATGPVRNVLSRVRLKMHQFDIDIFTIIKIGYGLRRKPGEEAAQACQQR